LFPAVAVVEFAVARQKSARGESRGRENNGKQPESPPEILKSDAARLQLIQPVHAHAPYFFFACFIFLTPMMNAAAPAIKTAVNKTTTGVFIVMFWYSLRSTASITPMMTRITDARTAMPPQTVRTNAPRFFME
jgi:hypothetical protein